MNQDNELNKMFREGLNEPGHHAEYREADWEALEQMLDERQKKRGIIVLLPYIGSVAAVLLVFFAWMFFKHAATDTVKKPSIAVNKPKAGNAANNGAGQQTTPAGQVASNAVVNTQYPTQRAEVKVNSTQPASNPDSRQNAALVSAGNRAAIAANKHPRKGNRTAVPVSKNEAQTMIAANKPDKVSAGGATAITDQSAQGGKEVVLATPMPEQNNAATAFSPQTFVMSKPETVSGGANADSATHTKAAQQIAKQTTKPAVKTASELSGTHFALTVLAASNINGVGSFAETQTGANIGLLFSAGRGRFTLSTGALYAKTPYATDFSNYHIKYQFPINPTTVNADCRVLDIPINLDYRVYGNLKNKLSIGTGLSSYLMLKEDYTYTYATYPGGYAPDGYSITNRNQHYFGVLNFDVLYQHRLNSKFSLDLQPYLKLPLTDIGYGHVQLQTAGVAVGFSWNIK
jgi:hypothetical protein